MPKTYNEVLRDHAKEDEEDRKQAVKALLQHPKTRKFLYWLLSEGRALGHQPFAGENALTTAFQCGTMEMGNRVLHTILETDVDGYVQILKEGQDERDRRDAELAGAEPERGTDYGTDFGGGTGDV